MGSDSKWYVFGMIFGIMIGVLFTVSFMLDNYKNGQIDAINGIIHYELVQQNDGSTNWEKIYDEK